MAITRGVVDVGAGCAVGVVSVGVGSAVAGCVVCVIGRVLAQLAIPAMTLVATPMIPARPRLRKSVRAATSSGEPDRVAPQKGHVASSILTCLSQPEQSSSATMRARLCRSAEPGESQTNRWCGAGGAPYGRGALRWVVAVVTGT